MHGSTSFRLNTAAFIPRPPAAQSWPPPISHILTSTDCCICTTPQIFSIAAAPQDCSAFGQEDLAVSDAFRDARLQTLASTGEPGFSSLPLDHLLGCLLHTLHEPRYDSLRDLAAPSTAGIHLPDRPYD